MKGLERWILFVESGKNAPIKDENLTLQGVNFNLKNAPSYESKVRFEHLCTVKKHPLKGQISPIFFFSAVRPREKKDAHFWRQFFMSVIPFNFFLL